MKRQKINQRIDKKVRRNERMDEYRYLEELIQRYPSLETIKKEIQDTYEVMRDAYHAGRKVLIAGNGGSGADAEHMVGELMKGFIKERHVSKELSERLKQVDPVRGEILSKKLQQGLPAIALTGHMSLSTAVLNDVDGEMIFAEQVLGYGKPGDVLLGITTSGNSKNVLYAAAVAKAKGMKVLALTGGNGGEIKKVSDVALVVPEKETFKIQELHLPIYHAICLMLEEYFF